MLVLAGCGGSDGGSGASTLNNVNVTGGDSPQLSDAKVSVKKTTTRVITPGDGATVKEGDTVSINYVAANGRTGKTFDNSFKSADNPLTTTLTAGQILPGFITGMVGQKVGTRVLVGIAPVDGAANLQDPSKLGLKKDDTMVFLFDIESKTLDTATGKAQKAPANVPQLILKDGKPSEFKRTATTPDKPTKLGAHVVIKGEGAEIKNKQTVQLQYMGQIYPDGKVFNPWAASAPMSFEIGTEGVIACWDQGILGQTVGSRVILECPSDLAYGDTERSADIPAGASLLFVVDLLAAF
ncbi:FKBP-type peptidyl-prolyl cis-trans isomerase [soil metagenome]